MSWNSGTSAAESSSWRSNVRYERLAHGRPALAARLVEHAVRLGRGEVAVQGAGCRAEQRVGDVVGIVVVGVPAPDHQVDVGVVLPGLEVRRHVAGVGLHLDAEILPRADEGRDERRARSRSSGWTAAFSRSGPRQARRREQVERLLPAERGPAPARVVPEHAGRDEARRRRREAAERPPDEVRRPHDTRQRAPHRDATSRRGRSGS